MMDAKPKDTVELVRRWASVLLAFISVGGIGFIIWASDARIKEVGYKTFVSKAEYERDLTSTEKLNKTEANNTAARLIRIESDVREIREWLIPAPRRGTNF